MALTTDQMERICVEAAMKKPPSLKSREALEFRRKIEAEAEEAKEAGQVLEIPPELP